jgi:hypothetical protein
MDWISLLERIAPVALAFTPAAPFIPAIMAGVKLAQETGGTKDEKKALAVETAIKIAQGTDAIRAGTVDPEALGKVVDDGIETAVGVVNLIHKGPEVVKVVPVTVPVTATRARTSGRATPDPAA